MRRLATLLCLLLLLASPAAAQQIGPLGAPPAPEVDLTNLDADNLTSGEVPDARLSSDIVRKNVAQAWTATQTLAVAGGTSCAAGQDAELAFEDGTMKIQTQGTSGVTAIFRICRNNDEAIRVANNGVSFIGSTSIEAYGDTMLVRPLGTGSLQIGGFANRDSGAFSGVIIGDGGTKPTCGASYRGTAWREDGGAGVADTVEICTKDADDNYTWKSLLP